MRTLKRDVDATEKSSCFYAEEKKLVHIRGEDRENKVESIEVLFHFRTAFPGGFDIVNAFVYSRFPQALLCTLLHVVCLTSWDIDLAGQLSVPVGALNSRRLSDRSMCLHQTVDTNSPSNERIDETAFYSPVSYSVTRTRVTRIENLKLAPLSQY